MIKSIRAVFAGIIVIVLLSIGTDMILEKIGIFPPQSQGVFDAWMLVVALVYRTVYAFIGGYIAAALSPNKPMRHVRILNIIGIIMGTLGAVAGWNLSAHWYPIALVIASAVAVWYGGVLKVSQKK